jgi:hypothetical protein
MFLSCSSAFRHQVEHRPCNPTELASFGDLEGLSVSVMFRSTLFPYNRARLAQGAPSPRAVWDKVASSVQKWLLKTELVMPSLESLLSRAEATVGTQPADSSLPAHSSQPPVGSQPALGSQPTLGSQPAAKVSRKGAPKRKRPG